MNLMGPPERSKKGRTDIGRLRFETAGFAKRFEGGAMPVFIEVFDNAHEYIIMSFPRTRHAVGGFLTTFGQM